MKKLFAPYEAYTLRSQLPPEELHRRLEEYFRTTSLLKACKHKFTASFSPDEIILYPFFLMRNSARAQLHCQLKQEENSTIIEVTAQQSHFVAVFLFLWFGFLTFLLIPILFLKPWMFLILLLMYPAGFLVIFICRQLAIDELPKIRTNLRMLLQEIENTDNQTTELTQSATAGKC